MSWTIAQHSGFITGTESHFLYYLWRNYREPRANVSSHLHDSYKRSLTGDSWLDSCKVDFAEFAKAIGCGIATLFAAHSQDRIWVDSSPEYVLVMDALVALFPGTRIVHMVRDARAVCKSMLHSGFGEPWATNLEHACKTWNHYVETGLAAESRLSGSVLRVRQEDLRNDPNATTRRVFDFLGAERPSAVLDFLQAGPVNSSYDPNSQLEDKYLQRSQETDLNKTQNGQASIWRPEMEAEIEKACGVWLAELGYI